MKKRFSLAAVLATVVAFLAVSAGVAQDYVAPKLDDESAWTLVLVPDSQYYSAFGRNAGILELQTAWIAENAENLNVGFVLQLGDLVNRNDYDGTGPKISDRPSPAQWATVSRAFERLDGRVPYAVTPGNHDYGNGNITANVRKTQMNKYFPVSRDTSMGRLIECCPNIDGEPTYESAAFEYKNAPDGKDYLVISLECFPRDAVLQWALELTRRPEYANHVGIVFTHAYMRGAFANNEIISKVKYEIGQEGSGNTGADIWNELLAQAENIRFIFCGHISRADDFRGCVGHVKTANNAGKTVHQILFDTQGIGGGGATGTGGDGWLQLLEFGKDGQTIRVKTFSPLFAISPTTQKFAWNRDPMTEYVFHLDDPADAPKADAAK